MSANLGDLDGDPFCVGKGLRFNFQKFEVLVMFHRFRFVLETLFLLGFFCFFHCAGACAAEKDTLKAGDKAGIQFTCKFPNGEIAASTSTAVAKDSTLHKSAVYLPRYSDDPLEATVGRSTAARNFPVPFLDEIIARIAASIEGMPPGETRTIEIRSERSADVPKEDQMLQLARTRQQPKEIKMTVEEYKAQTGSDPEVGAQYPLDSIVQAKVVSISQNEVLVRSSVQSGSEVLSPFGKATIREDGDQIRITFEAAKGTPVRMGPIVGRICDANEKMFTIDFGDPFGGEPLACEVKAERISSDKPSKEK
jgi:FKBP-type peptidyl-prolyl cis-trans isomerase 2